MVFKIFLLFRCVNYLVNKVITLLRACCLPFILFFKLVAHNLQEQQCVFTLAIQYLMCLSIPVFFYTLTGENVELSCVFTIIAWFILICIVGLSNVDRFIQFGICSKSKSNYSGLQSFIRFSAIFMLFGASIYAVLLKLIFYFVFYNTMPYLSDQLLQNFTGHPEHCYHEFLYSIDFATHSIPSLALIILAPDFVAQIVETPNAINFSDSGSGAAGSGGILIGAGSPDEQRPGNKSQFIDSLVVKKISYHEDMLFELNDLFGNARGLNPGLLDQAKSVMFMGDPKKPYSHYILTSNDLGVEHDAVSGKVITHHQRGVFIAQNADGEYRYAMVNKYFDDQCRRIAEYENKWGTFDVHVSAKSENFSLEVASLLTTPLYNIKGDTAIFLYEDIKSLNTDFYGDCTKYIDCATPNLAQKIFSNNALGYQLVDRPGLDSSNCDFQSHAPRTSSDGNQFQARIPNRTSLDGGQPIKYQMLSHSQVSAELPRYCIKEAQNLTEGVQEFCRKPPLTVPKPIESLHATKSAINILLSCLKR